MMIFTDGQLVMMRSKASWLLSKLKEWEKHDENTKISFILADFQEMCSMGRSIALDEVCATPWEYFNQPIQTDAAKNDTLANQLSSQGWDLHMATSGWLIWRRRKAVRDLEAQRG